MALNEYKTYLKYCLIKVISVLLVLHAELGYYFLISMKREEIRYVQP